MPAPRTACFFKGLGFPRRASDRVSSNLAKPTLDKVRPVCRNAYCLLSTHLPIGTLQRLYSAERNHVLCSAYVGRVVVPAA